ncbi:hypothetical protein V6N12_006881 [Hibiscus sabdariffa]|uniref:Aminotransferase-like plant mobile domain-containing protein n=1 Tax=Hibiscus sabdariffa TaxID=183260 RepID=A0ABR2F069_9ROSI
MVPTLYLALLEDVKTVKSYAWGAAMLAYLGLIIALEFIKEVNGHPREFPLMVQWHQKMVNFDPYARLDEYFLPLPYNRQVALKRCLTSIICIEKRIIYDPSVLMKRRLRKSHPLHDIPQTAPTQEHELEDVMQDHTEQELVNDIPGKVYITLCNFPNFSLQTMFSTFLMKLLYTKDSLGVAPTPELEDVENDGQHDLAAIEQIFLKFSTYLS